MARTLKNMLLSKKQNGRLDTLINSLLLYSKERSAQLVSKRVRGNVTGRQGRSLRCHKDTMDRYAGKENFIEEVGEYEWKVFLQSRDSVYYTVAINELPCSCDEKMNSHCEICGACAFRMKCNCQNAYQAGISCIHAHAVATFMDRAAELVAPVRKRFSSGCHTSRSSTSYCFAKTTLSPWASQSRYFLEFAPDDHEEQPPTEVVEQNINEMQALIEIVEQDNLKETYQSWEGT